MNSRRKPSVGGSGNVITVKVGSVSVKIYKVSEKKTGYEYFQVADFSSGRRLLRSVGNEKDAVALARQIASKTATGEVASLALTPADRYLYFRVLEILKPTGETLEVAVSTYARAKAKLGARSLEAAVDDYLARYPVDLPKRTAGEVLNELVAAKRADGLSPVYLKDLGFRIGKFSRDFGGQLSNISATAIADWLRNMGCAPRGRNNYRRAIITLFMFAASRGYVAKDQIDFDRNVAVAAEKSSAIEIFTPMEMRKLLLTSRMNPKNLPAGFNRRYASVGLTPFLALGAFAGLRAAEIERQQWEDINLKRGWIRVTAAKGNTAQKRLVPVPANLKQWLDLYEQSNGPVCELARTPDALRRLAIRANVPWKHNALRHSFISYRVAQTGNIPQTAMEAGNSVAMVNRHYRELVTPDEAIDWFAIAPNPDPVTSSTCQ